MVPVFIWTFGCRVQYFSPSQCLYTWAKITKYVSSSEAKSRKKTPRLQRGPPGAPPAGPPHQPGGAGGRGCAATNVLIGSGILAADAASIPDPGWLRQYPTLIFCSLFPLWTLFT